MRISTRIAIGLFLVAGLLVGALAYQLSLVDKMQGINRELSRTNLEAARVSVYLLQGLEGVREFAAKASILRDEEYRLQWVEWEDAVEDAILLLSAVALPEAESVIRTRIEDGWQEYLPQSQELWENPALLPEVESVLVGLRDAVDELVEVNEAAIAVRVESSTLASERARQGAWIAASSALALAGLLSILLFLSISGPLRRLTGGTREVANGRFDHRLDPQGPADLAGLARDFNQMAARLSELEDLKRDFISHVSHELKTPVAAIHETVAVLLEGLAGPLTEKQADLLELSRGSSSRLSAMIDDLLKASRLEAGASRYEPDRHELIDIVRSVLNEVALPARERGIRIAHESVEDSTSLICDEARIREVVANLVGNAVKFSPRGGRVRVSLTLHHKRVPVPMRHAAAMGERTGPFVRLSVMDEGSGIADDHKEAVFEKFFQIGRKERIRGQGVGLGLAISRQIVEAHEGVIWVEDGPEGGAIFQVVLPTVPFRWKEQASLLDEPAAEADPPPTEVVEVVGSRTPVRTLLTVLLLAFIPLATGCAGRSHVPDDPPPEELVEVVEEEPQEEDAEVVEEAAVSLGNSLLASGLYEAAISDFERTLQIGAPSESQADALWGLALAHLSAESPVYDRERAHSYLVTLEEEFAGTLSGLQASWARIVLDQLDEVSRQAEAQEALLQELHEALDMLRRIDLDRRPAAPQR